MNKEVQGILLLAIFTVSGCGVVQVPADAPEVETAVFQLQISLIVSPSSFSPNLYCGEA